MACRLQMAAGNDKTQRTSSGESRNASHRTRSALDVEEERDMGRRYRCALSILLLALVCADPAAAQRTTGEIVGKVTDESGAVLPGVAVTLRGAGVPGAPTTVTSET